MVILKNDRSFLFTLLFAALFFSILTSCKPVETGLPVRVEEALEKVREEYCPDRRLAVLDLNIRVRGKNIMITGETDNSLVVKAIELACKTAAPTFKTEVDLVVLPDNSVGSQKWGIISTSVASLRGEPKFSAELVNQILMGSQVDILKKKGGWYYVQVEDGYLGWLSGSFMERVTEPVRSAWDAAEKIVYTELSGKVYHTANENSMIISDLVGGDVVKLIEETTVWARVELPNGEQGFIPTNSYTMLETWKNRNPASKDQLIKTAMQFKGVPYLWGGNSSKGFDCSGFTQSIYRWNGKLLLRDASQQFRQGEVVDPGQDFENLQAGDLVFFGSNPNRITHVGFYLGNGKFIHSSGRVKINSFDPAAPDYSAYRRNSFQGARRYLQAKDESTPTSTGGGLSK